MEEKLIAAGGGQPTVNLLTAGSIWRGVWFLAWPTIISNVLQTAYGFINMVFLGRIGTAAQAAAGLADNVLFLQFAAPLGISVGTTALVARFYGAGTRADANIATRQSVILACATAFLTALPLVLLRRPILLALGARPDVLPQASAYMAIMLLASPLMFALFIITSAFRGAGDARTPLYIMLVATSVNVAGDYLLILGRGPFPTLGVIGAAYSTVISRTIALALAVGFLARSPLAASLQGPWRPDYSWFARILRIGVAATFQTVLRTGGSAVYYAIISRTPQATAAIAALTIGLRSEAIAFMPGLAFSTAATSLVGQNLGASRPDRAERSGWVSSGQGAAVMAVMGAAFFLFSKQIAHLFTRQPQEAYLTIWYLKINAVSEPFLALAMILTGALQGAGQTRVPALITLLTMWIIRVPLTWWLALGTSYGAIGGWISMSTTTIIGGLVAAAYFKWGRWRSIPV